MRIYRKYWRENQLSLTLRLAVWENQIRAGRPVLMWLFTSVYCSRKVQASSSVSSQLTSYHGSSGYKSGDLAWGWRLCYWWTWPCPWAALWRVGGRCKRKAQSEASPPECGRYRWRGPFSDSPQSEHHHENDSVGPQEQEEPRQGHQPIVRDHEKLQGRGISLTTWGISQSKASRTLGPRPGSVSINIIWTIECKPSPTQEATTKATHTSPLIMVT